MYEVVTAVVLTPKMAFVDDKTFTLIPASPKYTDFLWIISPLRTKIESAVSIYGITNRSGLRKNPYSCTDFYPQQDNPYLGIRYGCSTFCTRSKYGCMTNVSCPSIIKIVNKSALSASTDSFSSNSASSFINCPSIPSTVST